MALRAIFAWPAPPAGEEHGIHAVRSTHNVNQSTVSGPRTGGCPSSFSRLAGFPTPPDVLEFTMCPLLRNLSFVLAIAFLSASGAHCREHDGRSCTGPAACGSCEPACKAAWDDVKTKKPAYSMQCEYACARGYDCWCVDGPECRCSPPNGKVLVKKRLYKTEGEEKVEKVPKYEVAMQPAQPCDCARCRGVCFWNPFAVLRYLLHH